MTVKPDSTSHSTPTWRTTVVNRLVRSRQTLLLVVAVLLGLLVGAAITLFRAAIELFHELFQVLLVEHVLSPWLGVLGIIVALALAGAVVGVLMDRFIGHERHHGVAGIMEAVALAGGRLRYTRMPMKALASAVSLGAGASVGPEDPSVQIGSNLGSWVGQRFRLNEDQVRLLVAAGGASAVAAAFKAPIAGVFFALEVILNSAFETRSFGVIVLAAVVASAFVQAVDPAVEIGPFGYVLGSPLEILLFIPLGALLAVVSALFIRAVSWQHHVWTEQIRLPRPAKTALAGVLVGLVALALPQIMGPGQETMNAVLGGEAAYSLLLLAALGSAKLLMTALSLGGGFVGGVFAPTLFVGIMFGSVYGLAVNAVFPDVLTSGAPTYAIGGMAAMLAGVVRSPITAILLVFELTNDYRLILPIMLAAVVCMIVVERLEPDGIYVRGLKRKGVYLPQGREIDLLQVVNVADVMRSPAPTIAETATLTELRDALVVQNSRILCVMDRKQALVGVVTLSDLQRAYAQNGAQADVSSICTRHVITASPDESLHEAVQRLNMNNHAALPVVERDTDTVVGLFSRQSVIQAYTLARERRLQNQLAAEHVRLHHLSTTHVFHFQVMPGAPIAGRRIAELNLPTESIIVTVEHNGKHIVPRGSSLVHEGDWVTIVAPERMGETLQQLTQSDRSSAAPFP